MNSIKVLLHLRQNSIEANVNVKLKVGADSQVLFVQPAAIT